jgi:hypothetical protein
LPTFSLALLQSSAFMVCLNSSRATQHKSRAPDGNEKIPSNLLHFQAISQT